ncbi:MAG: hypothetical protein ACPGOV_14800 [Magnetovibrionaceae bacterium]
MFQSRELALESLRVADQPFSHCIHHAVELFLCLPQVLAQPGFFLVRGFSLEFLAMGQLFEDRRQAFGLEETLFQLGQNQGVQLLHADVAA